jgi:sporulation protein YlmC with PRC-barrel domain
MRLELGRDVECTDGPFGEIADVVIDPTTKRVTHLVVEPRREQWLARLVPIELADPGGDATGAVSLRATADEVRRLPSVRDVAYLRLEGFPVEDPDWQVGIQEFLALPYYTTFDLEPVSLDYALTYDRIPKSEVEIRRASTVTSADGHDIGHVDGFLVDSDDCISHLVLEHGHLWGRREVTVPIAAVSRVETDAVTLSLSADEVGMLREVPVQRWPQAKGR